VVTQLPTEDDHLALVMARRCCRTGELKAMRERLGLSSYEVAQILTSKGVDCTRQAVWRWETGITPKGGRAIALGNLILDWLHIEDRGYAEAGEDVGVLAGV
jgi:DNA-binding transcriptional regulator YiaG